MKKLNDIYAVLLVFVGACIASCNSDMDIPIEQGAICISLENVAPSVLTRSTPSEIGVPTAEGFMVEVKDAAGKEVYSACYSDNYIPLVAGQYEVSAFYGDNPMIAIDAPYYLGTSKAVVEGDKISPVSIECKVANALVSVRFGRDEAERARFDRFYSSYGLRVYVGGKYATVSDRHSSQSVYFRAGTSVVLAFTGVLQANGQEVTMPLDASGTGFPEMFQAADHAIVTLSLPDPESAAAVDISKTELEEATMEETIPLSWLPIPKAYPTHMYDASGNLVGTDIAFSNSYPGIEWKAEVSNADGIVLRTVRGTGTLFSGYADNTVDGGGWQYVPAGEYTATYYIVLDGKEQKTGTRGFIVPDPNVEVTVNAYTSYSLYMEGDVDGANACDAYTVYEPSLHFSVSPSLWKDDKYVHSLDVSLGGNPIEGTVNGNDVIYSNQAGMEPSFTAYELSASVTFDKVTSYGSKDLYITGLPVTFNPPTEAVWTVNGKHDWTSDCVLLGQNGTGSQYITCNRFAVPSGVRIDAPYKVMMHGATVATTLSLSFGNYTYFSERSSSGFLNNQDHNFESVATFTTTSDVSEAKANNSYGAAQTCSRVYYLTYKYGK